MTCLSARQKVILCDVEAATDSRHDRRNRISATDAGHPPAFTIKASNRHALVEGREGEVMGVRSISAGARSLILCAVFKRDRTSL